MPVYRVKSLRPQHEEVLIEGLVREWDAPASPVPDNLADAQSDRPVIFEEEVRALGPDQAIRLWVVWDAFRRIEPEVRTDVIVEAYSRAHQGGRPVTIAVGLTKAEAKKAKLMPLAS